MKPQTQEQLYEALLDRCRIADKTIIAVRAENHRLRKQITELKGKLAKKENK